MAGLIANSTFGVIMAITFRAALSERGETGARPALLDGLTPTTIVTYTFATQAIAMVISAFGDYALAARVRSGDIATDLGRPVDFSFFRLAHDLGRSAFHLLARGLSVMGVGWLVFRFPLPPWLAVAKFVPLVVLAAAIASRLWTMIGLASFWMRDGTGAVQLMVVLVADLSAFLQTPVRQLSLGQRMRGELAAALAHRPELLILDEPTIGLDLVSKDAVRRALRQLNETHGTTVLLTTHDLADIAEVCSRVVVINHGTIVEDGPLPTLIARLGSERIVMVELTETQVPLVIAGTNHMRTEGCRQWLRIDEAQTTAGAVIAAIGQQATIVDLSLSEPDFDDVVRRVYGATS